MPNGPASTVSHAESRQRLQRSAVWFQDLELDVHLRLALLRTPAWLEAREAELRAELVHIQRQRAHIRHLIYEHDKARP